MLAARVSALGYPPRYSHSLSAGGPRLSAPQTAPLLSQLSAFVERLEAPKEAAMRWLAQQAHLVIAVLY